MVDLFEQWETEQQQQQKIQKNDFKKSYTIDLHFNEWKKYLTISFFDQNMT